MFNSNMGFKMTSSCSLVFLMVIVTTIDADPPLNIVLIVADDLGWDDVSFHGSDQILTPNIDLLAYTGVALGRYYSHCVCTPSRSALLTGKYGHTLGMQGYPLTYGEDRGLPVTEKILPQYLKERGYATHLVGKWHVGLSRKEYLPTMRGFDSHFGHRGGYLDYYEYVTQEMWSSGRVAGLDLYRNLTADWESEGYITDLYNNEAKYIISEHDTSTPLFLMLAHNAPHSGNDNALLQAPQDEVRAQRHVDLPERRIYAAMMKKLDDSVGEVVNTLSEKGILQNTLIVFISDNGGMTSGNSMNYASNWPLRGIKMTPFEGGIKVTGLLWSPNLNDSHHLWNGYMHVSDWVPTLLAAVGMDPPSNIDGKNLWDNINQYLESERNEIIEIDDYTGFAAVIHGDYKLVTGDIIKEYSNYQGDDLRGIIGNGPSYEDALKNSKTYAALKSIKKDFDMNAINLRNEIRVKCVKDRKSAELCYPKKPCLYNLKDDPCESNDISAGNPDIVTRLQSRLASEMKRTVSRVVPRYVDPRSRPSLHNYTWTTWADVVGIKA